MGSLEHRLYKWLAVAGLLMRRESFLASVKANGYDNLLPEAHAVYAEVCGLVGRYSELDALVDALASYPVSIHAALYVITLHAGCIAEEDGTNFVRMGTMAASAEPRPLSDAERGDLVGTMLVHGTTTPAGIMAAVKTLTRITLGWRGLD